ncbi:MAG: lipopolysaccharide biosynthesis protein [Thermomicrobiales bacterium]
MVGGYGRRVIKQIIALPILRYNGLFFLSTAIIGLANYLLNTTAARHFAPGEYSQFGIMLNLLAALAPLTASVSTAVTRRAIRNRATADIGQTDGIQRTLVRHLSVIYACGLVLVALTHEHIGHFLRLTTTLPLYFVLTTGYWLILQGPSQAILYERGTYARLSLILLAEGVFRAIFGVTAITLGLGIGIALMVYTLSAALAALALPRPRAIIRGPQASRANMRSLYRDIGQLVVANICLTFLVSVDVIICRRYLDSVTADRYAAIAAMAKFFLFATSTVSLIAFTEVVRASEQGRSSRHFLVISFGLIGGLGFLFTTLCLLFGRIIMTIAFGDAYRVSGDALWITAVSACAMSVVALEVSYFNAFSWLWYLPVLVIGSVVTIAALPLAHHDLRRYAGIYALGTITVAIILLIPLFLALTGRIRLGKPTRPVSESDDADVSEDLVSAYGDSTANDH